MTIYTITLGDGESKSVRAYRVDIGDGILSFLDRDNQLIAAFSKWDWLRVEKA